MSKQNGKSKTKEDVVVVSTGVFRLKDKPVEKAIQYVNLRMQFGRVPEVIAIEKVQGQNNRFILRGFLPKEKLDLEVAKELPKK